MDAALAMELNGTEMVEKQDMPTALEVERSEEPREAEIMDERNVPSG